MVEQNPYLFRGTVELNVGYGPRALRRPKAECQRRTYDALEKVGAAPLLHRRVDRLSGGERRQVALARALAIAPRVLLLDEPFAELDREHTFKTEQLLRDRSGSTTVIFTTHDLAQAHRLASDVVSIIGGRISPGPLLNLFRGSVIRRAGGPIFCAQGIEFEIPESSPDATLASVDPDTIVVSTEPLRSSARNHYCGVITRVEARTAVFHLTIDCGAPVVATITRHSYDDLGLNAGRRVWVTFKSTAVRLY
jgi:molybdopterin-binding protein